MPRSRKSTSCVTYDALCGAGNGPGFDDRSRGQGNDRPRRKYASCGLPEAPYDKSITYTKTQRLTPSLNDLQAARRETPALFHALCCPRDGFRFPMRLLRRMECDFGRRICRTPPKLRRRLSGLLQAQRFARRVRQLFAGILYHGGAGVGAGPRLKPPLIFCGTTARLEAAPLQNANEIRVSRASRAIVGC